MARSHFNFPCFALPITTTVATSAQDAAMIRRCIELARRATGQTRPNPPVGCVLTDANGRVLSEGFHARAGEAHAEANALAAAREAGHTIEGATAYVSLEPCNHYGRTPPCSVALAKARVARVVIGMLDPDPRTSGGGVATLRAAGVTVDIGVERAACAKLTDGFTSRILKRRPIGALKYAMTLDGKIASETGSSKWITGELARRRVHEMRAEADAIVVGGRTVRADDPLLTVRGVPTLGYLTPIRVVMTRTLDLPYDAKLWDTTVADTVVFTADLTGKKEFAKELQHKGVVVIYDPMLTPDNVMQYLYERGCLTVMWECGGALAAQALKYRAVQRIHAFIAPKIIGGTESPTPIASPPISLDMGSALELKHREVETFDDGDMLVSGYLEDIEEWHNSKSLPE